MASFRCQASVSARNSHPIFLMETQSSLALPDLPGMGNGWELLLPQPEVSRRCTADVAVKVAEQREAVKRACVHLGTRRVAEAFGISREVVRALRKEAIVNGELDQFKEEEGRRCHAVADRLLDRLEDEVDKVPVGSLALNIGILMDKAQLLTGAPTARIQHDHTLGVAEVSDYIDSLPSVTPVHPEVSTAQKGGADLADVEVIERTADSQSAVSDTSPEERQENWKENGRNESERDRSG